MAGIYIHIPFCKQACHYCNFHFVTSLHYKTDLVNAILKEIELRSEYLSGETIGSIYFGGGTPSLLDDSEIRAIVDQIRSFFKVDTDAEITLEANPDDISEIKLDEWKQAGINRLSIGIQSFFDDDLRWMNRAHNAQQAKDNLQMALSKFSNITIDLIYGTPQLNNERWKENVMTAISLGIPHLSCYALTVEPKTPLHKMIALQQTEDVNPDKQSEQFLLLMQWTAEAGYEHYEISNFAKPGWRSRHNSSYWQGKKYLGLGPSAHSFNGISRQWNIANNNQYINSIQQGKIPCEIEMLTNIQRLNEYIMTALRTTEGINFYKLESEFGIDKNELVKKAGKFLQHSLIMQNEDSLQLTRQGKLLADGIAAELFY